MKKIYTLIAVALMLTLSASAQKVAMLSLPNASDTETSAQTWFTESNQGDIISSLNTINDYSVLFVIIDRGGIGRGVDRLPLTTDEIGTISQWVKNGGNLIVTNHATQLVEGIGRTEGYLPGIFGDGNGGDNPDIWGLQTVIGNVEGQVYDHTSHPIFAGLEFAPYNYGHDILPLICGGHKNDRNCMWDLNAYPTLVDAPNKVKDFEDKENAVVLGTWQHVVDYCCAGLVEFKPTTEFQGSILACGVAAYDWSAGFETDNMKGLSAGMIKYMKDSATSIESVQTTTKSVSASYNLAGQRVNDNAKGIVIINGKKIVK